MAKNILDLNDDYLFVLKQIAFKNGSKKPTNQDLVNLSMKITINCIKHLDKIDFKQITNLEI